VNKTCIIGANGYVGRHLADHLRSQGRPVLELSSRDGTGIDPATGLLPPDLTLDGVGAVVFAAQSPHYRNVPAMAWHLQAVNCVSAVQAAVAAATAGAARFVYLSTGNVYAPSFDPLSETSPVSDSAWYAWSKLQAERSLDLLRDRIEVNVVRVFGIYGPDQPDKLVPRLCASVDEGRAITLAYRDHAEPDTGLRINPCYIDDAVDVLDGLVRAGGPAVMNLAGPEVVGVRDIAETWARLRGREAKFQADTARRTFDLVADDHLLRATHPRTMLGLEEGLARVAAALREQGR
jgi:nucleoside-diphosphate-sugar epimerase